jgi:hypothetical protein
MRDLDPAVDDDVVAHHSGVVNARAAKSGVLANGNVF